MLLLSCSLQFFFPLGKSYNKIQIFDISWMFSEKFIVSDVKCKRKSLWFCWICMISGRELKNNWTLSRLIFNQKLPLDHLHGHFQLVKMQECKKVKISHTVHFFHHLENVLMLAIAPLSLSLTSQYTFIFMSKNYKARFFLRKSSQSTTTVQRFSISILNYIGKQRHKNNFGNV